MRLTEIRKAEWITVYTNGLNPEKFDAGHGYGVSYTGNGHEGTSLMGDDGYPWGVANGRTADKKASELNKQGFIPKKPPAKKVDPDEAANQKDIAKAEDVLTSEVKKRLRAGYDSDEAREDVYDGMWEGAFPAFDKLVDRIIARGDSEDDTRDWLGGHFAEFWDYLEL